MPSTEWKCLQLEKLSIDPDAVSAEDDGKFWFKTFTNFIEAMPTNGDALDKLKTPASYLTAPVYKLISEKTTYDDPIVALRNLYVNLKMKFTHGICLQWPHKPSVRQPTNK